MLIRHVRTDQAAAVHQRQTLRDLFRRLPPQSQQHRFSAPLDDVDEAMIQRLADHVDGVHHIALPLVVLPPDGSGRPAGRARRVQDPADPTTAETAFAVADEWQGRGPGTALVQALMQRRPAAVRRLHAAIDACNPRMPATHQARKQNWLICGLNRSYVTQRL